MRWLQKIALALLLPLVACTPALAEPALWVVRSPTATVYLFGTVHVLPKGLAWHYPALDQALAASGKLYVEEDDDSPATMQPLVARYGMDFTHPLSDKVGPAEMQRIDAAAEAAGVPLAGTVLDMMQPWLAALTIAVAPIIKAGYDPKSGADKQLEQAFKAQGKPIGAFETAEGQIKLLAGLSQALQLDLLHNALDDYAKGPAQIEALVHAWQRGDVNAIADNVDGDMRRHYPELYRVLLVDRNRNWAGQIRALLKQHATIFVAVGAAHLAGPDSVQVQLRRLGIASERLH